MAKRKTSSALDPPSESKPNARSKSPKKSSGAKPKSAKAKKAEFDHDLLRKLQSRLERLDRELLIAINRRAELAVEVADMQASAPRSKSFDAAAVDELRIDEMVNKNEGPLSSDVIRAIFRETTCGCRQLARTTRIGFLGPMYSYSYLAAVQRFGSTADLVPLGSIATVFEEVVSKNIDYGIVPLENSTDGRISDTLKMFSRVAIRVNGEINLQIHHNLLAKGPRRHLKRVCSKPQALSQCRGWLAEHLPDAEWIETSSTTVAAAMAAEDSSVGAIASREAGVHYQLDTVAAKIEDNRNNVTRFAVLGQHAGAKTGDDKTALLFQLNHKPGALADILAVFKRGKLNLTWIESFPLHDKNNEYFFFAELQGHESDLRVRRAVAAVQKKTQVLKVLGSYSAMPISAS